MPATSAPVSLHNPFEERNPFEGWRKLPSRAEATRRVAKAAKQRKAGR